MRKNLKSLSRQTKQEPMGGILQRRTRGWTLFLVCPVVVNTAGTPAAGSRRDTQACLTGGDAFGGDAFTEVNLTHVAREL